MDDVGVAVFHGAALERGGGVHVVEEIARTFNAPLYFGVCDDDVIDRTAEDVHVNVLCDTPVAKFAQNKSGPRNLYSLLNFQYIEKLHDYDVVIQSGNETMWYIPPEYQTLVRYVHNPPGPSYHQFADVGHNMSSVIKETVARQLRLPYERLADVEVANSERTQYQMRKYLERDMDVVHPPVSVEKYAPEEKEDFYFTLSRLTEGKGVEEIVRTFTHQYDEQQLIVGGTGPQEAYLRSIAGDNVDVRGWLKPNEKRRLLATAKALVLNSGNESFGIVPIEAMASGTPVLSVDSGYTPYQIEDGWNGLLYTRGKLGDAVGKFETEGVGASVDELVEYSRRFGQGRFQDEIRKVVKEGLSLNDRHRKANTYND